MQSNSEKRHLEHQAAKQFMRLYEQMTGQIIRHIWHNQPAKPDVSCYLNQQRLDLEIAHLYGSEVEAMHILGRDLDDNTRQELISLLNSPAELRLYTALNRLLNNKSLKSYDSIRVWLVIRNLNPLWSTKDFRQLYAKLHIPRRQPFEQVWLISDQNDNAELIALYPASLAKQENC
jgi:hypothetical protein